jgi:hypothetical protein
MERTLPTNGGLSNTSGGSARPMPAMDKIEDAAMGAHQKTDAIADKATEQVDRLSGTAHRAVNKTADAASSAAEWAAAIPEQAKQVQAQLAQLGSSATDTIRARPFATVAGALVVGYLVGRLARF